MFLVISALPSENQTSLSEIGVSVWCPGSDDYEQRHSLHWMIREGIPPEDHNSRGLPSFKFGETEYVKTSEMGPLLQDQISSLHCRFSHICIVGHGIEEVMTRLRENCQVLDGVKSIDTKKIWQFQQEKNGERTTPSGVGNHSSREYV